MCRKISKMNFSGIFQWRKSRNHFNFFMAKRRNLWRKRSILYKRMRRKISKMNFSGIFQWRKSRNHFNFFVAKNSASSFPPIKSKNDDCVDRFWSTWRSSILGFQPNLHQEEFFARNQGFATMSLRSRCA